VFLELLNNLLITGKILMLTKHIVEILYIGLNSIIKDLCFLRYTLIVVFLAHDFLCPLILLRYYFGLLLLLSLRKLNIRLFRVRVWWIKALLYKIIWRWTLVLFISLRTIFGAVLCHWWILLGRCIYWLCFRSHICNMLSSSVLRHR